MYLIVTFSSAAHEGQVYGLGMQKPALFMWRGDTQSCKWRKRVEGTLTVRRLWATREQGLDSSSLADSSGLAPKMEMDWSDEQDYGLEFATWSQQN